MNGTQLLLASMALALVTACGLNESQQLERELLINKGVKQYPSRCTRVDEGHKYNHHPARAKIIREPKYPVNAKELGIEGYVKLEFDLSTEGKPIIIHVLESAPAGVFDQAGIEALSTWLYQGEMLPCHAVQLNFSLPPKR